MNYEYMKYEFFIQQKVYKSLRLPEEYYSYFVLFIVAHDEANSVHCRYILIIIFHT